MFNTQKSIALAFGYVKPLLDAKSKKLFISDNEECCCKMCGRVHNEGYIDKKNSLFGDKNNSFYSFADTTSDFLCSYCYYISSSYKKFMQRGILDVTLKETINSKNEEVLKKANNWLYSEVQKTKEKFDTKEIKLEESQKKKLSSLNLLCSKYSKDNLIKAISLIFDYKILANFAKEVGEEDLSNSYNNTNDIADVIVFENSFESKDFRSTLKNNDLYEIFKNPPKPPFTILLKKLKGITTFELGTHTAKTTIDKDFIAINFGIETYLVDRVKVLECLAESERIYKKHRRGKTKNSDALNISDDVLFNRANSLSYDNYFHHKIRADGFFMDDYKRFINSFDKGVRFVSKILLESYREELKGSKCP